jgi:hypothetical protein
MSSSLLSAWRSLINFEVLCSFGLVIALVMIAKPESLRQCLEKGSSSLIKPAGVPQSDAKLDPQFQSKQHLKDSDPRFLKNPSVNSTNGVMVILKAAALLAILALSTLGLSTVTRGLRSTL